MDEEEPDSEAARAKARAGIRSWIAQAGRTLPRKAPSAVLTGMTAAALAPILVPELAGTRGPYAVQQMLTQLGGAGAGYLAAIAQETTAKLRTHAKTGDVTEETLRDVLDGLLAKELAGPHATETRVEITRFVRAVNGVDETVRAAYTSDVPGLGEHVVNAVQTLSEALAEFRALHDDVLGTLDSIQRDTAYVRTAVRDQGDELHRLSISIALLRRRLARPLAADVSTTANADVSSSVPVTLDDPGTEPGHGVCPYPGLAPFSEDYEEWFHGRDRLIADMLSKLGQRLYGPAPLIVMGASGAGKSSLLWVGLIPALYDGSLAVPGSEGGPDSRDWPLKVMTPGRFPLRDLAVLLADMGRIPSPQVQEQIAEDPGSTPLIIRQGLLTRGERRRGGRAASAALDRRLILIIDQFEEVFTQCLDGDERKQFIDALCAATRGSLHDPPPALVVMGIRAAFMEGCTAHPGLASALADPLTVGPMSPQELRQAIESPARQVGLTVETGLAATMLRDLGAVEPLGKDIATYDPGRLPLLGHALRETWVRRQSGQLTVAAYEAAGGIMNALATTADHLYGHLDHSGQQTAKRLLLRMVTVHGDAEDTRRRISRSALLGEFPAADTETVAQVLDKLEQQRLVTADRDTVQIAHEALLRYWPKLAGWLAEDRERHREQQQLTDHAHEWDDGGRHPDMLLPATKLAAAQTKLAASRRVEFGALEMAFLRASEKRQARSQRTRRAIMIMLAVLAALAGGFGVTAQHSSALASRQQALAQSRQLASEAAALQSSAPEESLLLSLEAYRVQPSSEAVGSLLSAQAGLFSASLDNPAGPVHGVAYDPAGSLLAAAGHHDAVSLWNAVSHRLVARLPGQSSFYAVAFNKTGNLLAGAEQDGATVLWNATTDQQAGVLRSPTGLGVTAVAFDPHGQIVATTGYDDAVTLWNPRTLRRVRSLNVGATVNGIAFSPNGTALAAACADDDVRVWNLTRPEAAPLVLRGNAESVQAVAFGPGSALLASGGDDGTIRLWDARTGASRGILSGSALPVDALAFSPDGTQLVSGGADDAVRLWDVTTLKPVGVLTGQASTITGLAFSPGGRSLASADADATVDLWDISAPPQARSEAATGAVAAPRPGGLIATVGDGREIDLWDSTGSGVHGTLQAPAGFAHGAAALGATAPSMAFSPDGEILAVALHNDQVALWNTRIGRRIGTLTAPAPLTSVAYRPVPGPAVVAAGSSDGYIYIWAPGASGPAQLSGGLVAPVTSLAFSPDGRLLAAGSEDGTFLLARVTVVGRTIRAVPLQPTESLLHPVEAVAFSPDGRVLATGSAAGTVELWDISVPGRPRPLAPPLTGPNQAIISVAFSSQDSTLAASSDDGTIHLWDVSDPGTPISLATLTGLSSPTSVSWEPGSHTVVGAAADGTVMSWDTLASDIAGRICASPLAASGPELKPYLTGITYHPICPAS